MDDGGTGSDVRHQAQDIAQGMQDRIEGLRGLAGDAGQRIREFARERPVVAIVVAAGIGFLAGRLLSRT